MFCCRRKRSVVQYKPDESPTEKQQRLEKIKKNAQEAALAVESLSDLSEDFDDFEIEEPKEISFPENIGTRMFVLIFFFLCCHVIEKQQYCWSANNICVLLNNLLVFAPSGFVLSTLLTLP